MMTGTGTDFGHVFVVRGDLFELASDALVVPTDAGLVIEPPWHGHVNGLIHQGARVTIAPSGVVEGLASGPGPGGVHGPLLDSDHPGRTTWLVATGVAKPTADLSDDELLEGAVDRLREVLLRFAAAFRDQSMGPTSRGCPLVAVPLLGHGRGGFTTSFRRYAGRLIEVLTEAAVAAEIDIALVIRGTNPDARPLEALCRLARGGVTASRLHDAWELGDSARPRTPSADSAATLQRLLAKARSGELVPFFGAGVSLAGGAPSWADLVRELDVHGKLIEADATGLDLLAQAQIVSNSYESEESFARAITDRLRATPVSLQHLLLAALDARDAVTTNFDDGYERAVEISGRGTVSVVPQQATHQRLLKLHGSLPRGRAASSHEGFDGPTGSLPPVLTQDQFLEHERHSGPLRGALQMMLLTGHVVFVGYSLRDPGLHAAIHEVRRIREMAGVAGADAPLATALQVEPSEQLSYLWTPTIDVLWPRRSAVPLPVKDGDEAAPSRAGPRELEILLDALSDAASLHELPVLALPETQLEPNERTLRELLRGLEGHFGGDVPHHVRLLLEAYGDRGTR